MRTISIVLLAFAIFAAGIGTGVVGYRYLGPRADVAAVQAPPPADRAALGDPRRPATGLYTDNEVRLIVERWTADDPRDATFLRVVPDGTTAPLLTVFGALGLDQARLGQPSEGGLNLVVFLTWQVSTSYNLSCMTAINDPENENVGYSDPKRRVYGIRIEKRDR